MTMNAAGHTITTQGAYYTHRDSKGIGLSTTYCAGRTVAPSDVNECGKSPQYQTAHLPNGDELCWSNQLMDGEERGILELHHGGHVDTLSYYMRPMEITTYMGEECLRLEQCGERLHLEELICNSRIIAGTTYGNDSSQRDIQIDRDSSVHTLSVDDQAPPAPYYTARLDGRTLTTPDYFKADLYVTPQEAFFSDHNASQALPPHDNHPVASFVANALSHVLPESVLEKLRTCPSTT